jgi:hypothetical protein
MALTPLKQSVLDAVSSPLTRVMYAPTLEDFLASWEKQDRPARRSRPADLRAHPAAGRPLVHRRYRQQARPRPDRASTPGRRRAASPAGRYSGESTRATASQASGSARKSFCAPTRYAHAIAHGLPMRLAENGLRRLDSKLQLLSGHSEEKSLAIYSDLTLADVAEDFPCHTPISDAYGLRTTRPTCSAAARWP